MILNSSAGNILRLKPSYMDELEGDASLGEEILDSPCLVPEDEFIKNMNQH